jgi:hypothetical protein
MMIDSLLVAGRKDDSGHDDATSDSAATHDNHRNKFSAFSVDSLLSGKGKEAEVNSSHTTNNNNVIGGSAAKRRSAQIDVCGDEDEEEDDDALLAEDDDDNDDLDGLEDTSTASPSSPVEPSVTVSHPTPVHPRFPLGFPLWPSPAFGAAPSSAAFPFLPHFRSPHAINTIGSKS